MNSQLLNWIKELMSRLSSETPKFFKVLQVIAGVITLVAGLPEIMHQNNLEFPALWSPYANKIISLCGGLTLLIAQLSTKSTLVGVQASGDVLKKTDEKKLPFTAKQEQKSADKHGLDEVKIVRKEPASKDTPASRPARSRVSKAPAKSVTKKK